MGIDVAKDWLDVASTDGGAVRRFANDGEGIAALAASFRAYLRDNARCCYQVV